MLDKGDMIRPFRPLAAWENSRTSLPPSGRLSGLSLAEVESQAFVAKRSNPSLPGYNAGPGEGAWVDATSTSNKWHGKYFAAQFPRPPEKVVRILDARVVGDPGSTNTGWEQGTVLRVIPEGARPTFEPGGASVGELREVKQRMVTAAATPALLGRAAAFEIARKSPAGEELPWDPREVMRLVENETVSYEEAREALEARGWSANVVLRLLEKGGGKEGEERRHKSTCVLAGTMKGSRGRVRKVGTPQRITSAIFLRWRRDEHEHTSKVDDKAGD